MEFELQDGQNVEDLIQGNLLKGIDNCLVAALKRVRLLCTKSSVLVAIFPDFNLFLQKMLAVFHSEHIFRKKLYKSKKCNFKPFCFNIKTVAEQKNRNSLYFTGFSSQCPLINYLYLIEATIDKLGIPKQIDGAIENLSSRLDALNSDATEIDSSFLALEK